LIFRGTFEHTLDPKHRLTVPSKFRAALAAGVVIAPSAEADLDPDSDSPRSISIWTPDEYEAFTTQVLHGRNPSSVVARSLQRYYNNNSYDAELDAANRLMIPAKLLEYATLETKVTVVGSGECIEVFDRDAYDRYNADLLNRIPEITARLGDTA
jgi:MraZ protein